MKYICELLKDLPHFPAGTMFTALEQYSHWNKRLEYQLEFKDPKLQSRAACCDCFLTTETINDPEWVRKEIDPASITDLSCPKCGGHSYVLETEEEPYKYSDGIRYFQRALYGRCLCGEKVKIFTYCYRKEYAR